MPICIDNRFLLKEFGLKPGVGVYWKDQRMKPLVIEKPGEGLCLKAQRLKTLVIEIVKPE
jgi:hypothetical protein